MRTPRRKLRLDHARSTSDLLLDEAMRIIAQHGVEELRIKDLAQAVGIRPPSVYRHFSSREDIIVALGARMMTEMAQTVEQDPSLSPREWMANWVRTVVSFYARHPAYVVLILRDIASPSSGNPLHVAFGPPEDTFARGPLHASSIAFDRVYARGVAERVFVHVDQGHLQGFLHGAIMIGLQWPYVHGRRTAPCAADLETLQRDAVRLFEMLTLADPAP